jgi:hypothetical protein
MTRMTRPTTKATVSYLVFLAISACANRESPGANDVDVENAALASHSSIVDLTFTESTYDFANPERGYYVGMDLVNGWAPSTMRANGRSLAIALVRLDAYRSQPLDPIFLGQLDRGFANARSAGIKVVLRFEYNSSSDGEDAPKAIMLGHIAQLGPVLQRNADVIAVMQAGFIGAWGEWHSSTNGLANPIDKTIILDAILAALPASRQVQVRTPMDKANAYPGSPLTATIAYDGSNVSRVAHHNDCFLASASDYGTYASPYATWQDYIAQDSQFTAVGGETCAVNAPRTDCPSALAEMAKNHWSFMSSEWNQLVINAWTTQGCGADVTTRLGYRFSLQQGQVTASVPPGGVVALELEVLNTGFSAPYNQRPVYVVLTRGTDRRVARLKDVDARRWPANTAVTISGNFRLPYDLPQGTYSLSLWLPDAATTLQSDPRFAVRFANQGTWNDATGDNLLTSSLSVSKSAPGRVDRKATQFVQIP